jgi:hypothetical protein
MNHRTWDSYVYDVGKWSRTLTLGGGECFDTGHASGVFNVYGTMHVHYPCVGHIKAVISVELPQEHYENGEQRRTAVADILRGLKIPEDETYEVNFRESTPTVSVQNHTNRHGYSDGV